MIPVKDDADRCRDLIERSIKTFDLDLKGLIVLTEAATGYYMLTPMIAAIAGAKKVYLLTRNSRFGKAEVVNSAIIKLAGEWGIKNRIFILSSRRDSGIKEADIVTNLGFVRPLNKRFLSRLNKYAVIPLMWETWEYRPEDLDLSECRRLNIPVLGTNEQHRFLRTMDYLGCVVTKILFELGLEVFLLHTVIFGDRKFGHKIMNKLKSAGAYSACISSLGKKLSSKDMTALKKAEVLVVADDHGSKMLIGRGGLISAETLYSINPDLKIVHVCGIIDAGAIKAVGLKLFPEKIAAPGHMSVTVDYAGPKPLIDLHAAGLKVGEEMRRARSSISDVLDLELAVLKKTSLAQGFAGRHRRGNSRNA